MFTLTYFLDYLNLVIILEVIENSLERKRVKNRDGGEDREGYSFMIKNGFGLKSLLFMALSLGYETIEQYSLIRIIVFTRLVHF